MYYIRLLSENGVSKFYDKLSGTHNSVFFAEFPYKCTAYKSFDRANKRLIFLKKRFPDYYLDLLYFDDDFIHG